MVSGLLATSCAMGWGQQPPSNQLCGGVWSVASYSNQLCSGCGQRPPGVWDALRPTVGGASQSRRGRKSWVVCRHMASQDLWQLITRATTYMYLHTELCCTYACMRIYSTYMWQTGISSTDNFLNIYLSNYLSLPLAGFRLGRRRAFPPPTIFGTLHGPAVICKK